MEHKEIIKQDIEKSINDWKNRISLLYDLITEWTKSIDSVYEVRRNTSVPMYEELMQKFSINPDKLEVLDVYIAHNIVVTFKPVGLWIIGANGRIDILHKNGSVILIDQAKRFQKSRWIAFSPKNRRDSQVFNKDYFVTILRDSK